MHREDSAALRLERLAKGAAGAGRKEHPASRRTRERLLSSAGSLHHSFLRGQAEAITLVTAIVSNVVHHRGYYIPADERPDIIQDSMLDLFRSAGSSKFASEKEFCGFARVITHRRCVDWMRAKRKRAGIGIVDNGPRTPGDELLAKERQLLGTAVMARLKKNCRELFALHAGLGMTYGQIATQIGRTEGALRTQAYECLKQAKLILQRIVHRRAMAARQAQRSA